MVLHRWISSLPLEEDDEDVSLPPNIEAYYRGERRKLVFRSWQSGHEPWTLEEIKAVDDFCGLSREFMSEDAYHGLTAERVKILRREAFTRFINALDIPKKKKGRGGMSLRDEKAHERRLLLRDWLMGEDVSDRVPTTSYDWPFPSPPPQLLEGN